MNTFQYTNDNKRYHTWNYYLRNHFGSKVFKVPLDAGFTCPNRDGHCGTGGCTFCSERGSGDFIFKSSSLLEQYNQGKLMMEKKWPDAKTIPYFQSYTNTYGTLDKIEQCLSPFLDHAEVVAIAIGTRADCLEDEKLEFLNKCSDKKEIWIELGLQSVHDETAKKINRGHDFSVLKDCVQRIQSTNCKICLHIINGLPGESADMMLETIKKVNELKVDAVKIHMLHLINGSTLTQQYLAVPFPILSQEEYVDIVCKQLQLLHPSIIVQRLTGDAKKEDLIAPLWTIKKTITINEIDKQMARKNWTQGMLVTP
ncbi:MAG: TIGR01212 family radical SAM protein [Anaerorhabdus sp.]